MGDRLCSLKDQFISVVEGQMGNLAKVNAKELGEVVDIVKDLAEASYYCKITEAMDKASDEEKKYYIDKYMEDPRFYTPIAYARGRMRDSRGRFMYTEPIHDGREYMRDMDKDHERMYYTSEINDRMNTDGYHTPMHNPMDGKSHISRRGYMEAKHTGDKNEKNKELEMYMKDLGEDLTEMIEGLELSEKQIVKQKLTTLANKL